MGWNLDTDRPIYIQLVERIRRQIVSGEYAPGERFPSVRDIAVEASVNPNTMQRALATLESEGLLVGSRTSGRTVTTDEAMIKTARERIAKEEFDRFYQAMKELSFTDDELVKFIAKHKKKD